MGEWRLHERKGHAMKYNENNNNNNSNNNNISNNNTDDYACLHAILRGLSKRL